MRGGMPRSGAAQRHVIVFDVNVYLDVAELLGAPFTWDKFSEAAARLIDEPVPHPRRAAVDSLKAIASCTSGMFVPGEPLHVYTSDHIERMVHGKAMQSPTPDPSTGYRGLGWSAAAADTLVDYLIAGVVQKSHGGRAVVDVPDGNPPLDHEDGMVFGACRKLAGDDPLCRSYCVTRDKPFIEASRMGQLSDHTRVMLPSRFVGLVRAARTQMGPPAPRSIS